MFPSPMTPEEREIHRQMKKRLFKPVECPKCAELEAAIRECPDCDGSGEADEPNPHLRPVRCATCCGEGYFVDGVKVRALTEEEK